MKTEGKLSIQFECDEWCEWCEVMTLSIIIIIVISVITNVSSSDHRNISLVSDNAQLIRPTKDLSIWIDEDQVKIVE